MSSPVSLRIERLVIDASVLGHVSPRQLQAAIERELAELLTRQGPFDGVVSATIPVGRAQTAVLPQAPRAESLGAMIAAGVQASLGWEPGESLSPPPVPSGGED